MSAPDKTTPVDKAISRLATAVANSARAHARVEIDRSNLHGSSRVLAAALQAETDARVYLDRLVQEATVRR